MAGEIPVATITEDSRMTTPKRAPRSGANRRPFEPPRHDVIDRTVWIRPERQPAVITLPDTSITTTTVSDADLGLIPDVWDQRAAERLLLDACALRRRA